MQQANAIQPIFRHAAAAVNAAAPLSCYPFPIVAWIQGFSCTLTRCTSELTQLPVKPESLDDIYIYVCINHMHVDWPSAICMAAGCGATQQIAMVDGHRDIHAYALITHIVFRQKCSARLASRRLSTFA